MLVLPVLIIWLALFSSVSGWELWVTAPWMNPAVPSWPFFVTAELCAGFLVEIFLVNRIQKWAYNQNSDLFAVDCLLSVMELLIKVRDNASLDMTIVRRDVAFRLGAAAGYMKRMISRTRPAGNYRGKSRPDIAKHADELAEAIRKLQVTALTAPSSKVVDLLPMIREILIALTEGQIPDIPYTPPGPNPPSVTPAPAQPDRAKDPDPNDVRSADRSGIFLCHSKADKDRVREIYSKLRADGLSPWLDDEDIRPGQDWEHEIRKAIDQSTVVLVFLSERWVTSRGFVQKEIKLALNLADEQPEGSIFLIPVRLEECEVPERLRRWQSVDLFRSDGYGRLVASLRD